MELKIKNYKLGSDPEVFLKRIDTEEHFPAIDVVKGTKEHPTQMYTLPKGFTWQVDGFSLEFNTIPSSTLGEWVTNHLMALDYMKRNIPLALRIDIKASTIFAEKYMEMPGANEVGCSVDFNAWEKCQNPKPELLIPGYRCCGGHLHCSFDEADDIDLCDDLIKTLDLFLSVPSVMIDEDTERRTLYGKAGCFRFGKSYKGVEHRTLSNFWLQSEELIAWVWTNTKLAIDFINEGKTIDKDDGGIIQLCINDYNKNFALDLIEKYKINVPLQYLIKTKQEV